LPDAAGQLVARLTNRLIHDGIRPGIESFATAVKTNAACQGNAAGDTPSARHLMER
jgi:hypothetical protein